MIISEIGSVAVCVLAALDGGHESAAGAELLPDDEVLLPAEGEEGLLGEVRGPGGAVGAVAGGEEVFEVGQRWYASERLQDMERSVREREERMKAQLTQLHLKETQIN